MLKDAQAILDMVKAHKVALEREVDNRVTRDDAMIQAIKDDSQIFFEKVVSMIENLNGAIKRIEGPEEVNHG